MNFSRCCVFVVAVVIKAYFADVVVVVVVVVIDGWAECWRDFRRWWLRRMAMDRSGVGKRSESRKGRRVQFIFLLFLLFLPSGVFPRLVRGHRLLLFGLLI